MKICFISIDVEHDFGSPSQEKQLRKFQGVENLDKILNIFKNQGISATLFITGQVLEKYKDKVKKWAKDYEIACHTWSHYFWNKIKGQERKQEVDKFIELYQEIFNQPPKGFRAPSHLIDEQGMKLLEEKGFLYDSSIIPHYPFFKKYRGYKGRAPLVPYHPNVKNIRERGEMEILEIPVPGQFLGIPLVGTWISKLPIMSYQLLFLIRKPDFLTLNLHSWDSLSHKRLRKIEKILTILKNKDYQFKTGRQICEKFSKD